MTSHETSPALAGSAAKEAKERKQKKWEDDLDSGVVRGIAVPSPLFAYAPFRTALHDWLQSRSEKSGGFPTPTALIRTFHKLREWGPVKATQALNISADNGWTGVFEPKDSGAPKPNQSAQASENAARLRAKMGK